MAAFVLLAEASVFAALRETPLLRRLLRDGEDTSSLDPDDESVGANEETIVRRDPARLMLDEAAGEGGDAVDARFAQLLAGTLCHVVRLTAGAGAPLARLADGYERFRDEATERVRFRSPEYRHVLVLVADEPIPAEGWGRLQALLSDDEEVGPAVRDHAPLRDVYVLLAPMNLGPADAAVAREVWPVAVSRLLLHLRLEGVTDGVPRGRVLAWRGTEVVPTFTHGQERDVVTPLLARAHRVFHRVETDMASRAEEELRDPTLLSAPPWKVTVPPFEQKAPWQTLDAAAAHGRSNSATHWNQVHRCSGVELYGRLDARVASEERAAAGRGRWVWGAVHEGPGAAHALQERIGLPLAIASTLPTREVGLGLVAVDRAQAALKAEVEDARACAEHYDAARFAFVGLALRGLFAVAGPLAVGWGIGWVHQAWTGRTAESLVLGGITAVVPLGAAWFSWTLERRRGRIAGFTFRKIEEEELGAARQAVEDSYRALVAVGAGFRVAGRRAARFLRLRALLARLQALLQRHGHLTAGGDAGGSPAERAPHPPAHARPGTFLGYTTVACSGFTLEGAAADVEALLDARAERMRLAWQRFADAVDGQSAGHFPVRETSAWLQRRYDELAAEAFLVVLGHAEARLTAEQRLAPFRSLRERREEQFLHYLTVRADATSLDLGQRRACLHVRPVFTEAAREVGLQGATIAARPALGRIPVLALLHDEIPVTLCADGHGFLAVGTHAP